MHIKRTIIGFFLYLSISPLIFSQTDSRKNEPFLRPFFTDAINIAPGGKMMLKPLLPYVDLKKGYSLELDLPSGIIPSKFTNSSLMDRDYRLNPANVEFLANENNGVFKYNLRPDESRLLDLKTVYGSSEVFVVKRYKGNDSFYLPIIKLPKNSDWKSYTSKLNFNNDVESFNLCFALKSKVLNTKVESGKANFKNITVKEKNSGKVLFSSPENIELSTNKGDKKDKFIIKGNIPVKTGESYILSFEAQTEDIRSKNNFIPYYAKTLFFDVDKNVKLPNSITWKVVDDTGAIYTKGELKLNPPSPSKAPQMLETSVWVAESMLQEESPEVQKFYIRKFKECGLNTILPEFVNPQNEKENTEWKMPIGKIAAEHGLKTRVYLKLIVNSQGLPFAKANPIFQGVNLYGEKICKGKDIVCPTFCLEGTRFDSPANKMGDIPGGNKNPFIGKICDKLSKLSRDYNIDGVWWDFEYPSAPYIKYSFSGKKISPLRARPSVCICERCRRALAESMKLSQVPSVEECCGKYYEDWINFRCQQNLAYWELIRQATKQGNPNASLGIYSGYGDYAKSAYGVDWKNVKKHLDIIMSYHTYTNNSHIKRQYIKPQDQAKKLIMSQTVYPYKYEYVDSTCASRFLTKNNLLKIIIEHCAGGMSLCGIWGMDDQMGTLIGEAVKIITEYENVFLTGKRDDSLAKVPEGKVEVCSWKNGARQISFVFNDQASDAKCILEHKDGRSQKLTVPARDCKVIEWTK